MSIFADILYGILSSYTALFIVCFIFSFLGFRMTSDLAEDKRLHYRMPALLLSLLNSCGMLVICSMFPDYSAAMALIGIPVLFTLENKIMISGEPSFFVFLLLRYAVNFVAVYDIMTAVVNIFTSPSNHSMDIGRYRIFLLNSSMLAMTLFFEYLSHNESFPGRDYGFVVHSRNRGSLIYSNTVLTLAVTGCAALLFSPVLGSPYSESVQDEIMLCVNSAIKAFAILIMAYLIFHIQGWQEGKRRRGEELKSELEKEMILRKNMNNDTLINYCINLNTGMIEDGTQYFSDILLRSIGEGGGHGDTDSGMDGPDNGMDGSDDEINSNYSEYNNMIDALTQLVVHEDYWDTINRVISYNDLIKRADTDFRSFNFRIMISPEKTLVFCHLSEENERKLSSYEKKWIWAEVYCSLVMDQMNKELLAYVSIDDIEKKVSEEKRADGRSSRDEVTGLPGREATEDMVHEKLLEKNVTGALFTVELVNYDMICGGLEPRQSAEVIKKAAQRISGVFRGNDITGRIGDSEFAVFTADLTDRDIITARAVRINEHLKDNITLNDGSRVKLTARIGISICPDDAAASGVLFEHAEEALNEAKISENEIYRFYSGGND